MVCLNDVLFQILNVTQCSKRVHFAEKKILRKTQKCKFWLKILILSFLWILEEKHPNFRIPCMKSLNSTGIHLWDE